VSTAMVPLGEIIDFKGGGTPRKDIPEYWSGDIPWATVKDFRSTTLSETIDKITDDGLAASAANLIPAGHVIVPTRMALGKAAINSVDLAINQDLRALVPKAEIDTRYLLHAMIGLKDEIKRWGSGATVKGITQKNLAALQIALPPLPEQKRIAAILDAADALRAKRRESIQQLDALIQSTFIEMFGDPVTNPMGWKTVSLDDVSARVTDGTHQSPTWSDSGIPFLFVSNIRDRKINFKTTKFISDGEFERLTARCPIEVGDILYTTVGSYGNPALVLSGMQRFAFQRHIAHIKPKAELISPRFLELMLDSPVGRQQADRLARGVAQKTLNLRELKSFKIFLPPMDIQQRFVATADAVDAQLSAVRAHLRELDMLFASLQSSAFTDGL